MPNNPTVTQFVCFDTPLPKLAFLPVWTPFATTYLARDLAQIVLRKRIGASVMGEAPDFISRNHWPEIAFRKVLARGDIGEGGDWPVKATQGGSFTGGDPIGLDSADGETVIALLKMNDVAALTKITISLGSSTMHSEAATGAPRQYDAVIEIAATAGQGLATARHLSEELAKNDAFQSSRVAAYQDALVLPKIEKTRRPSA